MTDTIRNSRFPLLFLIVLSTVSVYALCFLLKSIRIDVECCSAAVEALKSPEEYPGKHVIQYVISDDIEQEVTSPGSTANANVVESLAFVSKDENKLLTLHQVKQDAFNAKIFLNISWNDDYNKSDNEKLKDITNDIEDFFDRQFYSMEKSIAVNVQSVSQLTSGMTMELTVVTVGGRVELEDLQKLLGKQDLFDKIVENF